MLTKRCQNVGERIAKFVNILNLELFRVRKQFRYEKHAGKIVFNEKYLVLQIGFDSTENEPSNAGILWQTQTYDTYM